MRSQNAMVLRHLRKKGPLTPLQALKLYGINRLAARAWDLKQDGKDIRKRMVEVFTRNGKTKVASYFLSA